MPEDNPARKSFATEAVVRAPPDGYALLQFGPSSAINATRRCGDGDRA
jgi:hypothetical protein